MWGKKEPTFNVTPIRGSDEKEGRVFAVSYGQISKIVLRVQLESVKRTLLLYDPRSNDPEGFVIVALPPGRLPKKEELQNRQIEDVLAKWAQLDTDSFLDGVETTYSVTGRTDPCTRVNVRNNPPPSKEVAQRRDDAEQTQSASEASSTPPAQAGGSVEDDEAKEERKKAVEKATGRVKYAGPRDHSYNGRSYTCFTIDIMTAGHVTETFRGAHLEDRIREIGIVVGDRVTVEKVGKRGYKNLFRVEKHS